MFVLSDGFGEAVQEGLHRHRIGVGHHQRKSVVRARLHGGENIGEGEAPVAKSRRPLAGCCQMWQTRPFWPMRASSWKNRRRRLLL